ncbi:hypothetical protein Ancab_035721 [Ancistrocladus abbreviatus]
MTQSSQRCDLVINSCLSDSDWLKGSFTRVLKSCSLLPNILDRIRGVVNDKDKDATIQQIQEMEDRDLALFESSIQKHNSEAEEQCCSSGSRRIRDSIRVKDPIQTSCASSVGSGCEFMWGSRCPAAVFVFPAMDVFL